ncbi:MAG: nuclear transport factor 2 family protein [Armatimonadetes bacterium]|nr:nuclear transport factor 2 family protein [Armatimonadota bacterium]MDE2205796.1 nuclear transport factor 2 family protein [Armatimonadota bacterium]
MFLQFACLAAALVTPIPPKRVPPKRDTSVLSALNARYAAMSRDFIQGNIGALGKIMVPGYEFTQGKAAPQSRKQVLAMLSHEAHALKVVSWKRTITQLNVAKSRAVATVSGVMVASQRSATGKAATFVLTAVSHDTWQKGGGGWMLQSTAVDHAGVNVQHGAPHKGN